MYIYVYTYARTRHAQTHYLWCVVCVLHFNCFFVCFIDCCVLSTLGDVFSSLPICFRFASCRLREIKLASPAMPQKHIAICYRFVSFCYNFVCSACIRLYCREFAMSFLMLCHTLQHVYICGHMCACVCKCGYVLIDIGRAPKQIK